MLAGQPPLVPAHRAVVSAFKKYQSDDYLTIAINRSDLPPDQRPALSEPFFPCVHIIQNSPIEAAILKTVPTGMPTAAARSDFDYAAVLADALHVLGDNEDNLSARAWWGEWVEQCPNSYEVPVNLASCLACAS